jgi:hypothetical protein
VTDLIEKVIKLGAGDLKKSDKIIGGRKAEKPRICYFSLRINDFCLEIATSSFTHLVIR